MTSGQIPAQTVSLTDPSLGARTWSVTPTIELLVLALVIAVGVGSYFIVRGEGDAQGLLAPPVVALALVANLVGGIALLMLLGRRIARNRAARSPVGGQGRLHVRLVLLFSTVAAVPALLVTIFASLLFQYGVQFWYSDRARGVLENAASLTRTSYEQVVQQWDRAAIIMAQDLANVLRDVPVESDAFKDNLTAQLYVRGLSAGAVFTLDDNGEVRMLGAVDPYEMKLVRSITPQAVSRLSPERQSVDIVTGDRIQVFTRIPGADQLYLYAARVSQPGELTSQTSRAEAMLENYRLLLDRARSLQLRFNAALLFVSLLVVGLAVWIALAVADRLVRPVGELVDAVRRVEGGDLSARVAETAERDEVGTLSNAFNSMTARIETQNNALVAANAQLDSRRQLIEAVMSGVSAGVISIAPDRSVRLINSSAEQLLALSEPPIGRPLREIAPELDAVLDDPAREAIVQATIAGDLRTFAVRVARDGAGPILTFDDITQQLTDQRRAAWADVARRIAHEIKNPLTPIQLAAERLQRRYGGKVDEGDTTFSRLTDTIVRQVGDLRRMVDEFSSFARMPKPVFRAEALLDIARQTMFLHEVAHPGLAFVLEHEDPGPTLVCDRRQIGQALTNVVKNAVEAVEAKGEGGEVTMTLAQVGTTVCVEVADSGVGLPPERDRIVEPYMTTRARGTGLGLAIVKKIVEEHFGTMAFEDRPGGGTIVRLAFDADLLLRVETHGGEEGPRANGSNEGDVGSLAALTRYTA